jgi:parvulin-like peptidyl-prolyl isomerase
MSATIDRPTSGRRGIQSIRSVAVAVAIAILSAEAVAQAPVPSRNQPTTRPRDPSATASVDSPTSRATSGVRQGPGSAPDGRIIARIGDTNLEEDKVRAMLAGLGAREYAALARDPALLAQFVRSLLANQLVLEEALAKQWDKRAEVAEQVQRARDAAIVESYLHMVSRVPDGFPDESIIQNVYEANKTAFLVPRQFQVAQIFVALPANADKATIEKAARKFGEIQLKLKAPGADFAAIAKSDSDAKDTGERGGEIGWVPETQLRPEIKALVIGLAKGAVADPVKLDDGWHIVKLIDTKTATTRPLSEVRDELVQRIRDEQAATNRRAYLADLLKRNPPAINEIELARMLNERGQPLPR